MRRLSLLLLLITFPLSTSAQSDAPSPDWSAFEQAFAAAENSDNKIMVDIYAPWCGWCQRLEREVYTDADVRSFLDEHFEVTRIDIEEDETTLHYQDEAFSAPEMAVLLGAQGVPTVAFLDSDGEYLTHLPGFTEKDEFLLVLEFVASDAFLEMTYQEFVENEASDE